MGLFIPKYKRRYFANCNESYGNGLSYAGPNLIHWSVGLSCVAMGLDVNKSSYSSPTRARLVEYSNLT